MPNEHRGDPITIVNLVLCAVILAFGLIGWRRSGKTFPLHVGIAFGLPELSHLATILALKPLDMALFLVRPLAYGLVAFALYRVAFSRGQGLQGNLRSG